MSNLVLTHCATEWKRGEETCQMIVTVSGRSAVKNYETAMTADGWEIVRFKVFTITITDRGGGQP